MTNNKNQELLYHTFITFILLIVIIAQYERVMSMILINSLQIFNNKTNLKITKYNQ